MPGANVVHSRSKGAAKVRKKRSLTRFRRACARGQNWVENASKLDFAALLPRGKFALMCSGRDLWALDLGFAAVRRALSAVTACAVRALGQSDSQLSGLLDTQIQRYTK